MKKKDKNDAPKETTRRFFAFMLEYGLMEYEGLEYVSSQCVIHGNSMDDLFKEFCKANNYAKNDPNWERHPNGSISFWGFPVCFIEVNDNFELDEKTKTDNWCPKLSDLFTQEMFRVPAKMRTAKKSLED